MINVKGELQMIGENGPSSSSLVNDGRANVVGLGGGSPMARVAIMVGIKRSLFLCEYCIEFSTREFFGSSNKKVIPLIILLVLGI